MNTTPETTNRDFEFFESQLPRLLKEHSGEYVLVKDRALHGFYSSFEEALKQGYEKFGNMNFLVQEITNEKRMHYINSAFIS